MSGISSTAARGLSIGGRRVPVSLVLGAAIVISIAVLALLAPWIAPYPYDEFSVRMRLRPPKIGRASCRERVS
jgi:ABC-type dipeptide/oligopeptide/nickel transport system permease subunit